MLFRPIRWNCIFQSRKNFLNQSLKLSWILQAFLTEYLCLCESYLLPSTKLADEVFCGLCRWICEADKEEVTYSFIAGGCKAPFDSWACDLSKVSDHARRERSSCRSRRTCCELTGSTKNLGGRRAYCTCCKSACIPDHKRSLVGLYDMSRGIFTRNFKTFYCLQGISTVYHRIFDMTRSNHLYAIIRNIPAADQEICCALNRHNLLAVTLIGIVCKLLNCEEVDFLFALACYCSLWSFHGTFVHHNEEEVQPMRTYLALSRHRQDCLGWIQSPLSDFWYSTMLFSLEVDLVSYHHIVKIILNYYHHTCRIIIVFDDVSFLGYWFS